MSTLILQFCIAFVATLAGLIVTSPLAKRLGLIDKPSERKRHSSYAPLTGGLAIYLSMLVCVFIWSEQVSGLTLVRSQEAVNAILTCCGLIVFIGALDDRFDMRVPWRIAAELLIAYSVIEILDFRLRELGDLFGFGAITLDTIPSYLFTLIAIFGLINAFNMLDGLDGLLASLIIASLTTFHTLSGTPPNFASVFVVGSLSAFLAVNLQFIKIVPRCFLGDAGSKLLGFTMVLLLLSAASDQVGTVKVIRPVTALFCAAIPLFDMVFVSLRRVMNGCSPFSSDRTHIHHLLKELGVNDRSCLVYITGGQTLLVCLGMILHNSKVDDHQQMAVFLTAFSVYCLTIAALWRRVEKNGVGF